MVQKPGGPAIGERLLAAARRSYWWLQSGFSRKQYQGLSALKCMISYNKYGGYCIPESSCHRPVAQKILSHNIYEPETIAFMAACCGSGDIVHAGTYFGDFLPALSQAVAPNAKVWAFEPNRENYRCAKITVEINDLTNVVLTHAGLGAQEGRLPMKIAGRDGRALGGTSQLVSQERAGDQGVEMVPIVTIDSQIDCTRRVSTIQLDVEGHEKEALAGALDTIRRCLPTLVLEVFPDGPLISGDWFAENILSLGYQQTDAFHENVVFRPQAPPPGVQYSPDGPAADR